VRENAKRIDALTSKPLKSVDGREKVQQSVSWSGKERKSVLQDGRIESFGVAEEEKISLLIVVYVVFAALWDRQVA